VECVIQFVDALFSVIVFAQFRVCDAVTGFLCKRFDLLLDELDEFASKMFQITASHGTPLWMKRRISEMGRRLQAVGT
jgi:hypothetical protein